jgi:MFS transporter, CP family, cyanate transporter
MKKNLNTIMLILGIVLIAANLRSPITAVSPLIKEIITDTGMTNTQIGLITTLPMLAFAALSLVAPWISQRFGLENTLLVSLVVLTGGILLRSIPGTYMLYVGTTILGISIAMGNVLLPSIIKRDFPNRVGLLTGLYTSSMNIWGAIASGISIPIALGMGLGWRNTLMCWAIFSAIALIVWLPQFRPKYQRTDVSMGKNIILWHSRTAWYVTFFMGLQSIQFFTTMMWLPDILLERGIGIFSAGWHLSLMQFIGIPLSFIVPIVAQRLSSQRSLVSVTFILSIIGALGLLSGGTRILTFSVIMIGLANGAGFALALTFFGLRSSNPQETAALSGMAQSIGYFFAAAAPALFGYLHDLTNSWNLTLFVLMALSFTQLIVGFGAGRNAYNGDGIKLIKERRVEDLS